jgi:hypothetical protein
MASYGISVTITYVAWDTVNNCGKTGDVGNHTLKWIKDGVAGTPANSPAEVDSTNAPGVYSLVLTVASAQCAVGTLSGKSSSTGIVIIPVTLTFDNWAPSTVPTNPLLTTDSRLGASAWLTASGYTAPSNSDITTIKNAVQDGTNGLTAIKTAVGSIPTTPLLAANYTAPANTDIGTIKTAIQHSTYGLSAIETLVAAIPTTPLLAANYTAPDNTDIGTILTAIQSGTYGLNALLTAINSRLASSAYTAPDNTDIGTILTAVQSATYGLSALKTAISSIPTGTLLSSDTRLNHLDADISSRLAGSSYTAPDNSDISSIKSTVEAIPTGTLLSSDSRLNHLDADISSRLASSSYTAPDNTDIGTILTAIQSGTYGLSALLTAINSRLASSSYTAPDNSDISTILTAIQSATYGLSALKTALSGIPTGTLLSSDTRLNHLDADISSRLASSSYTAPDNSDIATIKSDVEDATNGLAAIKAALGSGGSSLTAANIWGYSSRTLTAGTKDSVIDGISTAVGNIPTTPLLSNDSRLSHLDADVSSRLATSGYTAPSNADITTIKNDVAAIPTNPLLTTDSRLNHLNADISSRLASASYTAPDNSNVVSLLQNATYGLNALLTAIGSVGGTPITAEDVWTYVTRELTDTRLEHLDADISSISPPTADDISTAIWEATTRTLTSLGGNITITPVVVPIGGSVGQPSITKVGQTITVSQGDTPVIPVIVGDGKTDYSGWIPHFAAKKKITQTDYDLALRTLNWIDSQKGTLSVTLSADDTANVGTFVCEIKLTDGAEVLHPLEFKLTVKPVVIP